MHQIAFAGATIGATLARKVRITNGFIGRVGIISRTVDPEFLKSLGFPSRRFFPPPCPEYPARIDYPAVLSSPVVPECPAGDFANFRQVFLRF